MERKIGEYEVYKLDEPQLQVGMPNTHKWAVGRWQKHGLEFVEAFRTRKAALAYIAARTPCEVCDELGHREEQHMPSNV